jgi:hypothetical protein
VRLLRICCTAIRIVVDNSKAILPLIRLVVDLLLSPQQFHNILTCRDVVDLLWIFRTVVDLLRISCTTVVQKIHSKSNKWSLSFEVKFQVNNSRLLRNSIASVDTSIHVLMLFLV